MTFISQSFAQSEGGAAPAPPRAADLPGGAEANGGEPAAGFPPFDPATWGSQLLWLAITFGALLYLMSRVALPRLERLFKQRSERIAEGHAEAGRLKNETDAAIAGYEQALAEARQKAHAIAQEARDETKSEIAADRARTEAELQQALDAAEAQIAKDREQGLADVDAIAKDAAAAMVELLVGGEAGKSETAAAVEAAMAERT